MKTGVSKIWWPQMKYIKRYNSNKKNCRKPHVSYRLCEENEYEHGKNEEGGYHP